MAKRILVVDDDENILNLERTILEQKGFDVTGAAGGVGNSIPGFRGSGEKALGRDADRLQREHLSLRLEQGKKALNRVSADLTRGGDLDVINDVETARKRLDKVVNRIRYAERGYS